VRAWEEVMNNRDCSGERSRAGRKPRVFMWAQELEQKPGELGEASQWSSRRKEKNIRDSVKGRKRWQYQRQCARSKGYFNLGIKDLSESLCESDAPSVVVGQDYCH